MKLKWYGHASFLITAADGTRILTDPYNAEVGYRVPLCEADYVTVSHDHFDHNSLQNVPGKHEVIKGPGAHQAGAVAVTGIATCHDEQGGSKRGKNTVYCFAVPEDDGLIRVCHLGDLGHQLDDAQVAAIGVVDVLLIPTGGTYTLDPAGAAQQIAALKPRMVVPMHWRTPALTIPLKPVDDFLGEMVGAKVERAGACSIEIKPADLAASPPSATPRIVILDYVR